MATGSEPEAGRQAIPPAQIQNRVSCERRAFPLKGRFRDGADFFKVPTVGDAVERRTDFTVKQLLGQIRIGMAGQAISLLAIGEYLSAGNRIASHSR